MESLIHVALAGVSRLCIIDQRWPHLRIGFYGDEANISENPHQPFKVLCLFLNILHYRPRSARLSRFLLCAIRSDWLIHPLTLRPILARITWSLNVAFHGYEPGQPTVPLCSRGDRFVLAECRGDQEFHRTLWQHAASWKSNLFATNAVPPVSEWTIPLLTFLKTLHGRLQNITLLASSTLNYLQFLATWPCLACLIYCIILKTWNFISINVDHEAHQ